VLLDKGGYPLTEIFPNNVVIANNLNDAWRDTMWCCVRNGTDYTVQHGSYEGQIRKQLPYLMIVINEPWQRPFNFFTPVGIPSPTDEEKINTYFYDYLITDTKTDREDYTYGQYITLQYENAIKILNKSKGNTNQTTIQIGEPNSIRLEDPPCLRIISFKVYNQQLFMTVYFRSWDIFAALPENLGGLQLLKEYVLMHLDFPVKDGPLIAFSDGAHLYEMYFSIVNTLNADQISIKEGD